MHLPFSVVVLLTVFVLAVIAFCLWLSLQMFRLKPDTTNSYKIIGFEMAFLTISLIGIIIGGVLAALFTLLFLIGGAALWIVLLKRFASSRYSLERAISAYATCYAIVLMLVAMGIHFFAPVYKIDGDAMVPTLKDKQTVFVYKFDKQPDNNTAIVYRNSEGEQVLGRIHGVPGETVAITGGRVEVGGNIQEVTSFTLSDNQYYVTVDNASYNRPPRVITADSIVGVIYRGN